MTKEKPVVKNLNVNKSHYSKYINETNIANKSRNFLNKNFNSQGFQHIKKSPTYYSGYSGMNQSESPMMIKSMNIQPKDIAKVCLY